MKKCLKIVLITVITFNLLGCYGYDMEMTVNKDKSVDFNLMLAPYVSEENQSDGEIIDGEIDNSQSGDDSVVDEPQTDPSDEEQEDGFWMPPEEVTPQNQTEDESLTETLENEGEEILENEEIVDEGQIDETIDSNYKITTSLFQGLYDATTLDTIKTSLEARGYTVVLDEETNGYLVTRKFNHIDEISSSIDKKVYMNDFLEDDFDDAQFFTIEKSLLKTTYKATFVFDYKDTDEVSYSSYVDLLDFAYKITLPVKADSHNASVTSNGGKTLEWQLIPGEENTVDFSFSYYNMNIIYVSIAIVVAIIILVIILIGTRKKKKTSPQEVEAPMPVEPIAETPEVNPEGVSEVTNDSGISFEVTEQIPVVESSNNEVSQPETIEVESVTPASEPATEVVSTPTNPVENPVTPQTPEVSSDGIEILAPLPPSNDEEPKN